MAVVHHRVHALLASSFEILAVRFGRVSIATRSGFVVSGSNVDVSRHMNQVAGGRRQHLEPHGAGQRPFGMWRRFDGVNVVMVCACVPWITSQYGLENRDDLFGAVSR